VNTLISSGYLSVCKSDFSFSSLSSKLPVSQTNRLTYGQVVVNQPIVCKPSAVQAAAIQAPMALA